MEHSTLVSVLILLAAAVLIVAGARLVRLPPLLAYLLVGILVGPHGLGWLNDSEDARRLAEFGVVFLMFSIGLEFSLPQLKAMRTVVFGLGAGQVAATMAVVWLICMLIGLSFAESIALGAALSMSSTAIVSKMLSESGELHSGHGRQIIGVLLFQDLAVVPFLILLPALGSSKEELFITIGLALLKIAVALILLLGIGQKLMRPWFHLVARGKSSELFVLNVLLVTLGLAWITSLIGLSLALGAFLAGMLISETEYRYQVEADIQPFRDVLLGLFFVTIGMMLDPGSVLANFFVVMLVLAGITLGKGLVVVALVRLFGQDLGVALRAGMGLAQAGEFGLVLLALANNLSLLSSSSMQVVLAAMVLSMLITPFILQHSGFIARFLGRLEWSNRALELHQIAVKSAMVKDHVILCGYGRSGQNLARFLEHENIRFIALDMDPQRVRAAAAAGETVVYGDASRREVLMAAGINRARALIVSYADPGSAIKVLHVVRDLKAELPVVVRTLDDADLDRLKAAGATEVVPEVLEGSLMLASHTLLLLGVSARRVIRSVQAVREARYSLLKGFFAGASDSEGELAEKAALRLFSIAVAGESAARGKALMELGLDDFSVQVTAVRRRNIKAIDPLPETILEEGDVLVLRGTTENLAAAEIRILQG